jgi:hypothetical protein
MMDCIEVQPGKAICTVEKGALVNQPVHVVGKPKLSKISGKMMKIVVINDYKED